MRWLRRSLAVIAAVYVAALGTFALAMRQTPDSFSRLMSHVGPVPFLIFPFETMWKDARRGALQNGDTAPDFSLPRLDRTGTVRLSSLRGSRPVVLVFGSYT